MGLAQEQQAQVDAAGSGLLMSAHYTIGRYRITWSNRIALARLRDGQAVHSTQLLSLKRSGLVDQAGTVYDEVLAAFNGSFPAPFFRADSGV